MKKVLCNITVLCFCSPSFAYTYQMPIIQSASADTSEYYAFLSLNSNYMSYSDYQILKINENPGNDKISNLYLKAQQYYYSKNFFKSLKIFKEIIGLRNKLQLSTHSKKLVLNSILKSYELSSSKVKQKNLLTLLRSTYPYIDLSELDIPQNLITKLDEMPLLFNNWEITSPFNKYKILIINGKVHEVYPEKPIKLPKGKFIISLISDSFYPISKIITKSQLYKWEPSSEWINSGNCSHPNIKINKLFKNTFIFYTHDCIIEAGNEKKILIKGSNHKNVSINDLKPSETYSNLTFKENKKFKWIKNKWLWIGLGALATSIAISSNQNNSKKTKQTKQGF